MNSVGASLTFARELRDICGAEYIFDDQAELQAKRIAGCVPSVAVEPASADEVAAIFRLANQHGLTVIPAGGFTLQIAGNAPKSIDILLLTSRLQELEHYDAGDLTIGVGAGWTISQLASKVASDRLLFAGDGAQPERSTVGGLLASGLPGPLRQGYGGLRDYCIGIRFVTGDGRKGKGGGRVVKNVAGFDLMKLLIGSWGRLAVITGASFKLFPAPRQTRTFVAEFANAAEAIAFRDHVLRTPLAPICLELVSPGASQQQTAAWAVYVRASGSDPVLARYRDELGAAITREIADEEEAAIWQYLRDYPYVANGGPSQGLVFALSLPLAEVSSALNRISALCDSAGLRLGVVGRIGVGHLLVNIRSEASPQMNFASLLAALRDDLSRDASLAVLSGGYSEAWKSPTHWESMRAVKQALDRSDILNRGRFRF